MAGALPTGFPPYLLPLREAVRMEDAFPKIAATKAILKPVAGHESVDLDVLLPNGCFLTVPVFDNDNLAEIKRKLWIKYKEMLEEVEIDSPQGNNSTAEQNMPSATSDTADPTTAADRQKENAYVNKESTSDAKKLTKKPSFYVRSPSLNFNMLNPFVEKRGETKITAKEAEVNKEEANSYVNEEAISNDETFMHTYSMRQKVENFMKFKFSKGGSMRVSSNDGYTKNAFLSSAFKSKDTASKPSSTSLFTPVLPVEPVQPSTSTLPINCSSTPDSTPKASTSENGDKKEAGNDEMGKQNSNPLPSSVENKTKGSNAVPPPPFETTASLVLADFESDLIAKTEKLTLPSLTGGGSSRLRALANEDVADYAFTGITTDAKNGEFYDDNLRLIDLNLFIPMLKLIEVVGNKEEKLVNCAISQIVGKPLGELERNKTTEFSQFRSSMHSTMLAAIKERELLSVDERIFYEYPPEMDDFETLQLSTRKIRKDIETYRSNVKTCSTEALLTSSSCDSLVEEVVYCNIGQLDQPSNTHTENFPNIAIISDSTSERKATNPPLKKSQLAETDSNAEYTEVIALTNANRVIPKHVETEYPLVLLGKQICTKEDTKSKKKKKKKSDKKDKNISLGENFNKSSLITNPFSKF